MGQSRDTLGIVADQEGGPTYAGDIACTLINIAKHCTEKKPIPWGVYHYSGLPHTSWFDFAKHIFAEVAEDGLYEKVIPQLNAITTADYPTPAKRPANSRLDCSKLEQTFGIAPSDWKTALKNIRAYSA